MNYTKFFGQSLNLLNRFALVVSRKGISQTVAVKARMHDNMDHATGIEKRELLAKAAGIEDPFGLAKVIKRGPSTKDCPTMIPSAFEGRLVGCVCHEDQRFVQWMWLEKGCPKRCECGYWFQLKEVAAL